MKLKFLSLGLVMVMLFTFTSCGENEKPVDISGTSEVTTTDTSSETVSENDSKTETTHVNGTFDFEETISNIYLFGKKISLPCTFEDLGEGYTVDFGVDVPNSNSTIFKLFYNKEIIGSIGLEKKQVINEKSQIVYLELTSEYIEDNSFNILNISFKSSKKDIIDILGNPTNDKEDIFRYDYDENNSIVFQENLNSKVSTVTIFIKGGNNQ